MSADDRELARDCWQALAILRHPSARHAETPEWLATTAGHLQPVELPALEPAR